MKAIGLCTLKDTHMLQVIGASGERLNCVPEHLEIGLHLIALRPARNQAWLLVERSINDVRHSSEVTKNSPCTDLRS